MARRPRASLCALALAFAGASLAGCLELSGFQTFRLDEAGEVLCADGDDGEGDGFVDCSDAECQAGWACAPIAPPEWTGPFSVETGPGLALGSGTCAEGGEAVALLFEGAAASACTACDCAEPACPFQVECGPLGTCSGALAPVASSAGCHQQLGQGSCEWSSGTPTSCVASGGAVKGSAVLSSLRVCAYPQAAGCPSAQVCTAAPSDSRTACVVRSGEHECPAGYPLQRVAYVDYSDARWCTPCVCELEAAAQCTNGSVTAYAQLACAGADNVLGEQACHPVDWASYEVVPPMLTAGACLPPSGGLPKGQVVLGSATTVCCRSAEGG
jgi:hypothetical protein